MRLTVNLDDATDERIDRLREANNWSKSRVVREAVEHYTKLQMDWEQLDEETLEWYIRLLHGQEHLILDIDHIDLLFSELDDISEAYWNSLRDIGQQHGVQWQGKITTLEEKLRI